jgi:hypothetical protein
VRGAHAGQPGSDDEDVVLVDSHAAYTFLLSSDSSFWAEGSGTRPR